MYECPNCGGNLKFDIPSQQLKCDYCLTLKDPYEITKDKDAEESRAFDVTIFTCPQCGGEILSTDTSAAEFCSFCGASTILDARISKEKRPAYIIPFKQTKDACKKAYIAKMKRAFFAPDELKDEKYIDSFRGIYIPYWTYTVSQQGDIHMNGTKSYQKGNYRYTDYYSLSGEIDACYYDLSYDASSSFSDNISEKIAPFDVRDTKKFTPSFLSGFYADTADVDSEVYKEDALQLANTASYKKIKNNDLFKDLTLSNVNKDSAMSAALCTHCDAVERTMYPVWFMSYRKKDRVAYATVNGQSGKVAADIPVDIKKYALGTVLLALPIFLILNLFFTFRPTFVLGFSILLAAVTFIIHKVEVAKIGRRDRRMDDRGYLFQMDPDVSKVNEMKSSDKIFVKNVSGHKVTYTMNRSGDKNIDHKGQADGHKGGSAGSLAAVVIALLIFLLNPVADYWYYGGAILSLLGILFTIAAIIQKYNVLATRKLPQFERKGGDDRA